MRNAYPIILTKTTKGYLVTVPDFNINTQGADIADAIYMARDAIGLMGIDKEDDGVAIPEPNTIPYKVDGEDISSYVDVDFTEYRKRVDNRAVKKNCTLPYWLSEEADKAGVNFSKVLQEALMQKLNVTR